MFEPYFVVGRGFDQYSPAYLLGWLAAHAGPAHQPGSPSFESQEHELRTLWLQSHGRSLLDWSQVKAAVKAAWSRAVAPPVIEAEPEPLGDAEKMSIALVLQAGQRFSESSSIFLRTAESSMTNDALRRFSQESQKLVVELEALIDSPPLQELSAAHSGLLGRARKAWAEYLGVAAAETLAGVLQRLQTWLERTERIAQQALPSEVAKLLKHHVMVLRGHVEALRWLSHGPA